MIEIQPQALGIVAVLLVVVAVLEVLRRGIVPERFAALWVVISLLLLTLAIFPEIATWASEIVGIQVSSNLMFFVASFLLLLISVLFSFEIGRLDARTRRLAEEVALLQDAVIELRPDVEPPNAGG